MSKKKKTAVKFEDIEALDKACGIVKMKSRRITSTVKAQIKKMKTERAILKFKIKRLKKS